MRLNPHQPIRVNINLSGFERAGDGVLDLDFLKVAESFRMKVGLIKTTNIQCLTLIYYGDPLNPVWDCFPDVFKIKRKQAAEERERQYALTDPLTGMPNRRAGIEHLTRRLEKSRDSDAQTTVCFIDVDKLKIVNDTWGHREGDQLINILCRLIQSKLRESDLCCRFGGDEFLIVFYDASVAEATRGDGAD